jgi:cell division septation protein DedD
VSAPAPLASAIATPATPTPSARFTIEFGPFFSAAEAERLERRLMEAGYSTVRSRRPTGSAVYAVLIERVPTAHEGKMVAAALREQGLGEAVVASTDPLVLRVGRPLPLRGAVELAERVRAAGHQVRVAAQPGQASAFVIRHGSFTSRDDAEAKRRELGQLDLPAHQVVPVP